MLQNRMWNPGSAEMKVPKAATEVGAKMKGIR